MLDDWNHAPRRDYGFYFLNMLKAFELLSVYILKTSILKRLERYLLHFFEILKTQHISNVFQYIENVEQFHNSNVGFSISKHIETFNTS